jgi:hypothetical protein
VIRLKFHIIMRKIIRIFLGNVPTVLALLCQYGETNDIFFPFGLVQLSPRDIQCRLDLIRKLKKLLRFTNRWANLVTRICTVNILFVMVMNM